MLLQGYMNGSVEYWGIYTKLHQNEQKWSIIKQILTNSRLINFLTSFISSFCGCFESFLSRLKSHNG